MLFKKSEDRPSPQMFYGTFGMWQMDPHGRRHHNSPNPQHMLFYMMPVMNENYNGEHKPHRWCHGRKHWKHGHGHHEMNPEKVNEMMNKMQEMHKSKKSCDSFHRRHGFCRRTFSGVTKNEQKQDPSSESFFEKQSIHSNIN